LVKQEFGTKDYYGGEHAEEGDEGSGTASIPILKVLHIVLPQHYHSIYLENLY
jgi:hypothetical protein